MRREILTFMLLSMPLLALTAQNQYFVSLKGNDRQCGSAEKPFGTIERALAEARKSQGETTVFLREGTYRLTRPIVFTHLDGGENKPLTLRAYPGEQVVITSGQVLETDWQAYEHQIMKTKIDKSVSSMDMLLKNGEICHMARYPNYDSAAVRFNGTSADATSPQRVKRWKHPEGGYLHAMHVSDWGDFHYRILGKEKDGKLILEGGWQNNRQSGLHPQNRMVENIFEELDAPNEWFYKKDESALYYFPVQGENVNECTFEAPVLKHLVEFNGTEDLPVTHITLKDITFTQTVRTFMEKYEPLLRSDWTIYRGGAICFKGAEDCSLTDCSLFNLGGNAVFVSGYNRRITISGSHFTRIGASAICLVGEADAVRSPSFEYSQFVPAAQLDRTVGPKSNNYPADCVVTDNLIHSIGLFEKQITGVELSMCRHIIVSHNSIYDTPRAGINVSEGTWGGHIIEYNDVFDTVKETGDHGSFNSWGRDRFWHPNRAVMDSLAAAEPSLIQLDASSTVVLRHNRFRCDRGWDIDLDDGSGNYHIYNNLCLNGGIKLREGFGRVVENNILVNNTFHPHVWFKNSGDVFVRNVVMSPYQPIQVNHWGKEVDYNIFVDSVSYRQARKLGVDEHSIVYTPVFRNPGKGDYWIENSSDPIFLSGFQNFDMNCFGVVSKHLKAIARTPQFPEPIIAGSEQQGTIISWKGLRIKNLETLGERSATGMDSERGVYVVSVDALSGSLRDYIRPNDVILGLAGKVVENLSDLKQIVKDTDWKIAQSIVLFRNQNEQTINLPAKLLGDGDF